MEETVLICEDSQESIFTAVYQAYEWRLNREHVYLQIGEEGNLRLFAEYLKVETNKEKASKVAATIISKMGEDVYWDICCVLASEDVEKAQAVYRTIITAIDTKQFRNVMTNVKDAYIQKAFELARATGREVHHLYGFLRFQELENGVLYAKIGPKNNIVTLLIPHFSNRYPLENFVIHDDIRQIFVIHPAGKECIVLTGDEFNDLSLPNHSEEEEYFQSLFWEFCHTIAIKERKNLKLQQNMLPLRFQEYMVEFSKK
ncbi:MAG: TIGR03915 family putative DNA repair protein [Lachnospiraceae bacterium]|nr:TIGR03915 family putative DNA repair protein [Lachnospiraceae bacterium]